MDEEIDMEYRLASIIQGINVKAELEAQHVISPEEQRVIDTAERVRSRIVEVGLAQGQFDRVTGKRLEQLRTRMLHRRFGVLPTLEFREDTLDNIIVDAPRIVVPGLPSLAFGVSLQDSEPDFWPEMEDAPNATSRWFEQGMFIRSTVKINSIDMVTCDIRGEFGMADQERARVRDYQFPSGITINEENRRIPYFVSPERLQLAGTILDLTLIALQSKEV